MSTPRNPENKRHQATFRIPADLLETLDREAAARVVGRSLLTEWLIREGLKALPKADPVRSEPPESSRTLSEALDEISAIGQAGEAVHFGRNDHP